MSGADAPKGKMPFIAKAIQKEINALRGVRQDAAFWREVWNE